MVETIIQWIHSAFKPKNNKKPKRLPTTAYKNTLIQAGVNRAKPLRYLDQDFFDLLIGIKSHTDDDISRDEEAVLDQITDTIAEHSTFTQLIPRLPTVVPELIYKLRNYESSSKEIANVISQDPALTGEVLKVANSPLFRVEKKITSVDRAVVNLGQKGIREMILHVAVKPIARFKFGNHNILFGKRVWLHSAKTAVACRYLASNFNYDPFSAYLAGLISNVGLITVFKLLDASSSTKFKTVSTNFQKKIINWSTQLTTLIAHEWELPQDVIVSTSDQMANKNYLQLSKLGRFLFLGSHISKLHILIAEKKYPEDEDSYLWSLPSEYSVDAYKRTLRELQGDTSGIF